MLQDVKEREGDDKKRGSARCGRSRARAAFSPFRPSSLLSLSLSLSWTLLKEDGGSHFSPSYSSFPCHSFLSDLRLGGSTYLPRRRRKVSSFFLSHLLLLLLPYTSSILLYYYLGVTHLSQPSLGRPQARPHL